MRCGYRVAIAQQPVSVCASGDHRVIPSFLRALILCSLTISSYNTKIYIFVFLKYQVGRLAPIRVVFSSRLFSLPPSGGRGGIIGFPKKGGRK